MEYDACMGVGSHAIELASYSSSIVASYISIVHARCAVCVASPFRL